MDRPPFLKLSDVKLQKLIPDSFKGSVTNCNSSCPFTKCTPHDVERLRISMRRDERKLYRKKLVTPVEITQNQLSTNTFVYGQPCIGKSLFMLHMLHHGYKVCSLSHYLRMLVNERCGYIVVSSQAIPAKFWIGTEVSAHARYDIYIKRCNFYDKQPKAFQEWNIPRVLESSCQNILRLKTFMSQDAQFCEF